MSHEKPLISWQDFEKVELRVGTVVQVDDFPEARKPAFKLTVDFGQEFGIRRTSAQVTKHYTKEELLGMQVVGVCNFPKKQIANFQSEFLVTGFPDAEGNVVLISPGKKVPNGGKLF